MTTPSWFWSRFHGIKDNYILLNDPNPPILVFSDFFTDLKNIENSVCYVKKEGGRPKKNTRYNTKVFCDSEFMFRLVREHREPVKCIFWKVLSRT